MPESTRQRIVAAGLASVGLVLFGLFINAPFGWGRWAALGGLGLILFSVLRSLGKEASPADLFGFRLPSGRPAAALVCSALLGGLLAVLCRWKLGMPWLPVGLGLFAPVAACIGATEELIVRGYLQGRLAPLGRFAAVLLAASVHTAYKCALFLLPEMAKPDFVVLAFWTFVGGAVFGLLRERTRSVLPPLLAHAAFDIVLYGSLSTAPWWVW